MTGTPVDITWATRPRFREGIMVTPEYARAYIDEITRFARSSSAAPERASIARLLRRLSR